jgi:RNA polymerase sigma-70 factor (ECF subfamily)
LRSAVFMNATRQPLELGHTAGQRHGSESLRALHDEHAHSSLSSVVRLTRDRLGAQDTGQEALLRAWRNMAVLERSGSSERGWLFTVARRIDRWRSAGRRREVLTDPAPGAAVENMAQQTADRLLVLAALQTLSIEHRQTLFETYYRGASVTQAAETLGVPAGTIKCRTHYALRALRQALDEMGGVATSDVDTARPI